MVQVKEKDLIYKTSYYTK